MIDRREALAIASNEIAKENRGVDKYVVCDEMTLEYPFGWVFFWIPDPTTGIDPSECFGNSPIIVDRRDGSIHYTGTAEEAEVYAERYARTGSPHQPYIRK